MDPKWAHLISRRVSLLAVAERSVRREREALAASRRGVRAHVEAQELVQRCAEVVQNKAHRQVARVVTKCLRAVFPDPYRFMIHFERKRGKTEARFTFRRGGEEVDPLGASGMGVVDVAALALRLACLVLSRPPRRRALFLDEPFHFVQESLLPRVRALLEVLSREMRCQVVLVTHSRTLRAGRVLDLGGWKAAQASVTASGEGEGPSAPPQRSR